MKLKERLDHLASLFGTLALLIGRGLPVVRARHALSTLVAVVLIFIIIIAGVAIIVVIVFAPGGPSVTTVYP